MRLAFRIAAAAILGAARLADAPLEGIGFDRANLGQAPAGWGLPPAVAEGGWRAEIVEGETPGSRAVRLFRSEDGTGEFGNLMRRIPARALRGWRVRLEARLALEPADSGDRAQMWLRVDRMGGQMGDFDNMHDRPVSDRTWTDVAIVADVAEDAEWLAIGFMALGSGRSALLAADVRARVIGAAGEGNVAAAPLGADACERVAAFVRLSGALRYFHPALPAVATDWLAFDVCGIDAAIATRSPDDLATRLRALVEPIAPTVQVWVGTPTDAPEPIALGSTAGARLAGLVHDGLGKKLDDAAGRALYSSRRVVEDSALPADQRELPDPPCDSILALGSGICARIPHVLPLPAEGSLPPQQGAPAPQPDRPAGWKPSLGDRSVRLAAVGTAWNILQHFYPYWDVVDVDWSAELPVALEAAAQTAGEQMLGVLERLVTAAQDGHGFVQSTQGPRLRHTIPVLAEWIEGQLVVTAVAPGTTPLARGDAILAIAGAPVDEIYAAVAAGIPASTEGFRRVRAVPHMLAWGEGGGAVAVAVRSPDGATRTETVGRVDIFEAPELAVDRPRLAAEIAPGIRYVDLDGLAWEALEPHLDELAASSGLVFDLRGYPGSAGKSLLHHLTKQTMFSAHFQVPRLLKPDQQDVQYLESRWTVDPQQPRLPANVAFITDARAISYAESCLAIVEAYELGEIVGAATAGTNGNINRAELPGGFVMIWTGMRVVKHDGKTVHQGVGVAPTIPCAPTIAGIAAGRDELLERAAAAVAERVGK